MSSINLISEILSIRIFLFLIISLSVFVLEPYVIYKLGLKYAFERIKLPVYRTFIKYSTFYSAKYSEFFEAFPINNINDIIRSD